MSAWNDFAGLHGVGDVLNGRVTKVLPFGALVEVEGVSGLLRDSSVWPARPQLAPAEGSTVQVRIDNIDADNRRVSLVPA
jgi:small subunit ribosomal protein S1